MSHLQIIITLFELCYSFYINEANNPDQIVSWWELLYFSFTCLTSVGFGEITPVSDSARSIVIIEQTSGVLYLAILISRLMSMRIKRE
ncbi:MAG: two pore domain potassium channel family protein [Nitrosomonas sp.]|nr:two pore domain potassium channel family protein [Nitrosomonas sp.]MBK7364529.1 two pore domain potassium channel family protein [Nitrosomonas sp.]